MALQLYNPQIESPSEHKWKGMFLTLPLHKSSPLFLPRTEDPAAPRQEPQSLERKQTAFLYKWKHAAVFFSR